MKKGHTLQLILIIIATLLYFSANIQRVAVPGAIFDILQSDLSVNASSITALGASFMYIYAVGQLIVGLLVSRYGGNRIITYGALIFALGGLLFTISNTSWILYLSRALVGFGSAAFYLGIIQEIKNVVSHNNFGIALSIILFVGYFGGIVANAPLVLCVNDIGWRTTFLYIALFTLVLTIFFIVLRLFIPKPKTNKSVKFNFDIYIRVLRKKENLILYGFGCLNYGIYYLLQTVIGKKFLEDFCGMKIMSAAIILSLMGALYAIAGPVLASISKAFLNRRTVFLKTAALNTLISIAIIITCLIFNLKTPLIALLFCTMAFLASMSPLLIPLIHDVNGQKDSNIAVCIMTACFYFVVAILGNISGLVLNFFKPEIIGGVRIYSNNAYITVFGILLILSLVSIFCVFKMKESKKTIRFLKMCKYMEAKYGEHWHDKYEHDIYTGV